MNKIELNHWYLNDNELSIALLNFHVKIKILKNSQFIYYQTIIKSENKDITLNFYSIEDAISFIEKVVEKCQNIDEVVEKYGIMLEKNSFKSPFSNKNSVIELTPYAVRQAIISYFGEEKNYKISVKEELSLNKDNLDLKFYLIENLECDGIKKEIKTLLTDDDLKAALNHYINFYNYELINYKYIGGIHKVGYNFGENTPHYDGIQLTVKKKAKGKTLHKKL